MSLSALAEETSMQNCSRGNASLVNFVSTSLRLPFLVRRATAFEDASVEISSVKGDVRVEENALEFLGRGDDVWENAKGNDVWESVKANAEGNDV